MTTPEQRAREVIDRKLAESGWVVQSREEINLSAGPGGATPTALSSGIYKLFGGLLGMKSTTA